MTDGVCQPVGTGELPPTGSGTGVALVALGLIVTGLGIAALARRRV